ncbi:MAG: PorP/SprF family type IX secretion system membrane protein [Vicingaceae bacterium]
MNRFGKIGFILVALLSPVVIKAQDIHFSQFSTPSSFLNPALTGNFYGDWRAGIMHRDQWRSIADPYVTTMGFFDRKFYLYSKRINAGIIMAQDRSGRAGLTHSKIYLNLSYHIENGRSTLMFGIQPGLVFKYFDASNLTFPEQWDQSAGYFNGQLNNFENGFNNRSINYFDLGAGVNWTLDLPGIQPSVGFALFHLNQANESFNGAVSRLKTRQVIHANARVKVSRKRYFLPEMSMNGQNRANSFMAGFIYGKAYSGQSVIIREAFFGLYARTGYERNADAIIPMIGIIHGHWRTALSYDINISNLNLATESKGAFELSLVYTAPNTIPKHAAIPCERF